MRSIVHSVIERKELPRRIAGSDGIVGPARAMA
jgi:hypothetical protein